MPTTSVDLFKKKKIINNLPISVVDESKVTLIIENINKTLRLCDLVVLKIKLEHL